MAIHPKILALAAKVTAKRARAVIDHILKHGSVSTEELKDAYGYDHPPRAARDVRECGIPLVTTRVEGKSGRKIGAYTFGDPDKVERHKLAGRSVLSKALKLKLLEIQGSKCAISGESYEPLYLSVDHRIPYEVAGDQVASEVDLKSFMLISSAAQRQKSWACEHCINWKEAKSKEICQRCVWASPEAYDHIACEPRRRVELSWINQEVEIFKRLEIEARRANKPLSKYLREIVDNSVAKKQ